MVGELIMLPLRAGVGATRLCLRAAEEAVAVVADATGRLLDTAVSRTTSSGDPVAEHTPATELEPDPVPEPKAPSPVAPIEQAVTPPHVSEEPEIVEENAEPGAEDGAGPSVHVSEPWDGYSEMRAADVVDRLTGAAPAELAAIQLYESERQGRATILEAVERELRISTGSGSQS